MWCGVEAAQVLYSLCPSHLCWPAPHLDAPHCSRRMLGERLLAKVDYDCDRDLRTLELLKLRFGEGALLGAEIMLKVGLRLGRVEGGGGFSYCITGLQG